MRNTIDNSINVQEETCRDIKAIIYFLRFRINKDVDIDTISYNINKVISNIPQISDEEKEALNNLLWKFDINHINISDKWAKNSTKNIWNNLKIIEYFFQYIYIAYYSNDDNKNSKALLLKDWKKNINLNDFSSILLEWFLPKNHIKRDNVEDINENIIPWEMLAKFSYDYAKDFTGTKDRHKNISYIIKSKWLFEKNKHNMEILFSWFEWLRIDFIYNRFLELGIEDNSNKLSIEIWGIPFEQINNGQVKYLQDFYNTGIKLSINKKWIINDSTDLTDTTERKIVSKNYDKLFNNAELLKEEREIISNSIPLDNNRWTKNKFKSIFWWLTIASFALIVSWILYNNYDNQVNLSDISKNIMSETKWKINNVLEPLDVLEVIPSKIPEIQLPKSEKWNLSKQNTTDETSLKHENLNISKNKLEDKKDSIEKMLEKVPEIVLEEDISLITSENLPLTDDELIIPEPENIDDIIKEYKFLENELIKIEEEIRKRKLITNLYDNKTAIILENFEILTYEFNKVKQNIEKFDSKRKINIAKYNVLKKAISKYQSKEKSDNNTPIDNIWVNQTLSYLGLKIWDSCIYKNTKWKNIIVQIAWIVWNNVKLRLNEYSNLTFAVNHDNFSSRFINKLS